MIEVTGQWLFHGPNMLLAALLYTLLGRYILSLVFRPNSDLVIWRVFRQITDPILKATRALTPAVAPDAAVMLFAVIWLIALRMAWFLLAAMYGFLPGIAS
jgi:YggT family protein